MFDRNKEQPDTEDLIRVARIKDMPSGTRTATIKSVCALRDLETVGADLPVAELQRIVDAADPAYRAALGPRAGKILSDAVGPCEPGLRSHCAGSRFGYAIAKFSCRT